MDRSVNKMKGLGRDNKSETKEDKGINGIFVGIIMGIILLEVLKYFL